jgi:hypothetical protein
VLSTHASHVLGSVGAAAQDTGIVGLASENGPSVTAVPRRSWGRAEVVAHCITDPGWQAEALEKVEGGGECRDA